jgi:hypothetical protein
MSEVVIVYALSNTDDDTVNLSFSVTKPGPFSGYLKLPKVLANLGLELNLDGATNSK